MAFSPKIKVIDATKSINSNFDGVVDAIYKLLKIQGSIQTLLLGGSKILNKLYLDFFKALGENKTLEHLNMDLGGSTSNRGIDSYTHLI